MRVNIKNKFVLTTADRTVAWVHKDTYNEIKKYAWAHNMSIVESIEKLVRDSLERCKTS